MQAKDFYKGLKKSLVAYITVGDPLFLSSVIDAMLSNGVDVLELGLPTRTPKYDGPTIRASYKRALDNGVDAEGALELCRKTMKHVRHKILFTYFDTAVDVGLKRFMEQASFIKAESVLFPDLLIDYFTRLDDYLSLCKENEISPAFFITSTFPHKLVEKLASLSPMFIYLGLMASTGVHLPITITKTIKIVKALVSDTPLIVGFGLLEPSQVKLCIESGADGVVIGSAIIRILEHSSQEGGAAEVASFLQALRGVLLR